MGGSEIFVFALAMRRLFSHIADIQFAQKVYLDLSGLSRPQVTLLLSGVLAPDMASPFIYFDF